MRGNKWTNFQDRLSPTQFVVLGYLLAILIASLLLWMPFTHKKGASLSYLDALFTATSAVTVTGLSVTDTAGTFNIAGHLILLICFQIGGIGIMALGTFLWLLLGRNIGLSYRRMIMVDQNRNNLAGLVKLIRMLLILVLILETCGAALFTAYFYFSGIQPDWRHALYHGIFHAISAYTNAGFDIFGNSLADFTHDYFVQTVTMLMVVLGAIGFPVLLELREYLWGSQPRFRFSLFTKMTSLTFLLLTVFGAVGIWLVEKRLFFEQMNGLEKGFHALFYSVTARSGGLSTIDVAEFSPTTQLLISLLMFIGASPSSVGGGIRTTTFALVLLTLVTYATGKTEVRAFQRSIKEEDIIKSLVAFAAAVIIVCGSIVVLYHWEQEKTLISIVFEVTSAFGTCGLSTGITAGLTVPAKIVLMALMFLGRIGTLSFLFLFRTKKKQSVYSYPHEEIMIS